MTRRLTRCWLVPARILIPRTLAWHTDCLRREGSRFGAEGRLAHALDDPSLSDDDFHTVRLLFDQLAAKGWLS